MNRYLVEFLGTFFLVLTVGVAAVAGLAGNLAPFAIGGVLMVMIYAGGHLSGAHFNPAVSLAAAIRGKLCLRDLSGYLAAQLAAGLVASWVAGYIAATVGSPIVHASVGRSLAVEFLFTFALAWVVLNSATAKGTAGNSFYGLAIGGTVLVGALTVGSISGGAFNPAVAVGLAVMGKAAWADLWIYLLANLAGGAAAGVAFKTLNPPETEG